MLLKQLGCAVREAQREIVKTINVHRLSSDIFVKRPSCVGKPPVNALGAYSVERSTKKEVGNAQSHAAFGRGMMVSSLQGPSQKQK